MDIELENKELSRIEILFQDDNTYYNIEKKYNKLIKLKIEPYIDCIVNQYYLNVLGGEFYQKGLIGEIDKYISSINKNIEIIAKYKNAEETKSMLSTKLEESNKLKNMMIQKYQEYSDKAEKEEKSKLFNIFTLHNYQLDTYKLYLQRNNIQSNNDISNHLDILKNKKVELEDLLEKQENIEDKNNLYYTKLLENQIGVIEQQIDLLR